MAASNHVSRVFRNIIKTVRGTVTDKNLQRLGEYAVGEVVKRTRLGYGVERNGGRRHRLKGLSPHYVMFRRENKRYMSEFTSPGKSNLTFTGQMLDSMKVTKARFGVVTIGPTGRRKGPKKFGGGLRNSTIAIENEKRGRFFNFLTDLEIKKVKRYYERHILSKTK